MSEKQISSTREHEDHKGQTLVTSDHDVIRQWAKARDAQPATVPGTEHDRRPGVLTFDFPGYGGDKLRHISWDDWFRTFDDRGLRFLYQEHLRSGKESNFFKLQNPNREDG